MIDKEIINLKSPVEFYLIGTVNNKRTVLAKSIDANIDLKSYATISYLFEKNKKANKSFLEELFYSKKNEFEPLKVDTNAFQYFSEFLGLDKSQRLDNLTFVWRGLASQKDKEYIKELFDDRSHSIYEALYANDYEQFEWDLSDIISACDLVSKSRIIILNKKKTFYRMFFYLYGILLLLILILSFIKIAFKI
ncbi:hypothetical protein R4463_14830 [Acinetobacter baumannii]|uniref:hypothetical protein n=1 Tax=Acinetobacter baumannii TaxID=470 RepID=UPI00286FD81F|nr:hypothetical protein [Acinetobacter baumannii]MDR9562446.1 hypothetical protein [Acinetobacter baumannii]MDV7521811.1 hypothetical protein [Acinetobacter baumannii]